MCVYLLLTLTPHPLHTHTHPSQQEHTGRVFRLQFDDFQIVSSSHDDTILIWDFLDPEGPPAPMETDQSDSSTRTVS